VREKNELESNIESEIIDFAQVRGWWEAKFVSPGLRGVCDRIMLRRGRTVFIEVKRPGEEPTPQQKRRMMEIRAQGAEVYWVTSLEQARGILR
jgi:hypothetical protein